jgi:hypothetical protein
VLAVEPDNLAGQLVCQVVRECLRIERGIQAQWPTVPDEIQLDFVRAVSAQRVTWLIHKHVRSLGLGEAATSELARAENAQVFAAMRVQRAIASLAAGLRDAGIRALIYKGVPLALITTGEATARGATDVDILVELKDMQELHRWLVSHEAEVVGGYCPSPESPLWDVARRFGCELPYRWNGVEIDAHWRIDRLPQVASMTFSDLWARRETVLVGGAPVQTPGRVDALLISAAHGTKEHWRHLRWVVDLVRQSRSVSDWPTVFTEARKYGCSSALAVGLAVARHLDPESVPEVRQRKFQRLGARAWSQAVTQSAPFGRVIISAQVKRLQWMIATVPRNALPSLLARQAYTTLDMAEHPVPRRLAWFYPLIRPVLMIRRLVTGRFGPALVRPNAHVG